MNESVQMFPKQTLCALVESGKASVSQSLYVDLIQSSTALISESDLQITSKAMDLISAILLDKGDQIVSVVSDSYSPVITRLASSPLLQVDPCYFSFFLLTFLSSVYAHRFLV